MRHTSDGEAAVTMPTVFEPAPALGMVYFAKEEAYGFLPSLLDVRVLAKLAEFYERDGAPLTIPVTGLGVQTGPQLTEAVERLVSAQMLAVEGEGDERRVSLLEGGRTYYGGLQEVEKNNKEACKRQLRTTIQKELSDATFAEMETWMQKRTAEELVAVLGGDKRAFEGTGEQLQRALMSIHRCKIKPGEPLPALYLRTLGHLASAFWAESCRAYASGAEKTTRVIVDTNVAQWLLVKDGTANPVCTTILRAMRSGSQLEFLLAQITLQEMRGFLAATGRRCQSWQLQGPAGIEERLNRVFDLFREDPDGIVEKGEVELLMRRALFREADESDRRMEDAAKLLGPLGVEFFVSPQSPPTFADFADLKMRQLEGRIPLQHLEAVWNPVLFDTRSVLTAKEVDDALSMVRNCRNWRHRRGFTERHDVELLLYTKHKNLEKGALRHVVWTHHRRLAELARIIGVDPELVLFGPGLNKFVSMPAETLRDYVRYMFLRSEDDVLGDAVELRQVLRKSPEGQGTVRFSEVMARFFMKREALLGRSSSGFETQSFLGTEEEEEASAEQEQRITASVPSDLFSGPSDRLSDNGWADLTMDWGISPGGHGVLPLRTFWLGDTPRSDRCSMLWHISPHTVTHFDLPWALDALPAFAEKRELRAIFNSAKAQQCMAELIAPRQMPVVLIDFTDLRDKARQFPKIRARGAGQELCELFEKVRIDLDTLVKRIPDSEDLSDALVVLHTGWAATFMPTGGDLSSLTWEGAHPWMTHPWLDSASVIHLLGRRAAGIAIDALMVDCPLYIAANAAPQRPSIREATSAFFGEAQSGGGALTGTSDGFSGGKSDATQGSCATRNVSPIPFEQPGHVETLRRFRLLAESLLIPDDVKNWYPETKSYVRTVSFIATLSSPFLADAAFAKILVRDPRPSTTEGAK